MIRNISFLPRDYTNHLALSILHLLLQCLRDQSKLHVHQTLSHRPKRGLKRPYSPLNGKSECLSKLSQQLGPAIDILQRVVCPLEDRLIQVFKVIELNACMW